MLDRLLRKENLVHVVAVISLMLVSFFYCFPVLEGKKLAQADTIKHKALSHETMEHREKTGEEALWTTHVFAGMTAININTEFNTNILPLFDRITWKWLPSSVNKIFLLGIGCYLLLLALGVNPWLALIAAAGYSISSNLLVSMMAGHNTKVVSIAHMAPALGGIMLVYRKKIFIGAVLVALFTGLMSVASHYQIIYYFLLCASVISIIEFVFAIREKRIPQFAKNVGLIAIAGIIGAFPNFSKVYNVFTHNQETIRGGASELTSKDKKDKGGLDRDYAFSWSYGIMESFTTVIPSFMGGASGEQLSENGKVAESLENFRLNRQQKQQILRRAPLYIGSQPFLQGTVYFGAAFIFLFILSLLIVEGRMRVWFIALTLLSFMIAWGKNFPFLANFLYDYFPVYNKFRTPSMALAISGLIMPVAGIFALDRIINGQIDKQTLMKRLKLALYIAGGLMVMLLLYGMTNDWIGPKDSQYQGENSPWGIDEIYEALLAERKSNYLRDWFMSTAIMAVVAALIWFYQKGKLGLKLLIPVLALVIVGDHWRVSKRYLNENNFVAERNYAKFRPSKADEAILKDQDPHFKVVNLTLNPWTDGHTCYHHKNIGGHHAAKLQRYQDLITHQLSPQLQMMQQGVLQSGDRLMLDPKIGSQLTAYNMLNTKYYIVKENSAGGALLNPHACGKAWFVDNIQRVATADEEMEAISTFNPNTTALVHEEYADALYDYNMGKSPGAEITFESYAANELKYTAQNDQDGLAVFSEVYYSNGWTATIDGEEAEIYRVNYLLRAIKVPAGEHEIIMKFEPASYRIGETVSMAGSGLFVVFLAGMVFLFYRKSRNEESA